MPLTRRVVLLPLLAVAWLVPASGQSDLDAFMAEVLARRDDNWKAQQQYVLDERESIAIIGPARTTLWGEQRDYTWFIREGFFVRSPLRVNGVTVSETDRRKYEDDYLRDEKRRQAREVRRGNAPEPEPPAPTDSAPADFNAVIRQTTRPGFISSAYFLRFRFDGGRYALVGREALEGRQVLRIEYYPTNLFREENRERDNARRSDRDRADDNVLMRAMNKGSKVTLWIDPANHQILRYTFDDLSWNFFPGAWLISVSKVQATMNVREMFPEVWLPAQLAVRVGMDTGAGPLDVRVDLDYHDYRLPSVDTRIGVPGAR
jgi:hypothetical protein